MTIFERITTKPGYKLLAVAAIVAAAYSCAMHERHRAEQYRAEARARQDAAIELAAAHRAANYAGFLRAHGHPTPDQTAQAIVETARRPRVMLALVAQEGAGTTTRGRAGEMGQCQVIARYWGEVPTGASAQIEQGEAILDRLQERAGSLEGALTKYNGSRAYAKAVMAKLAKTPLD